MARRFTKYSANGNHFILLDGFDGGSAPTEEEVKIWCDSHFGIGADGVAQITSSPSDDFRFRLWNADGSEAEMCGNASRAAAWHYLNRQVYPPTKTHFQTMNGVYHAEVIDGRLWIRMGEHSFDVKPDPSLFKNFKRWFYINTGVPHLVLEVEEVEKIDLLKDGAYWRRHSAFPRGTNVDFIQIKKPGEVSLRVFERGVEGETWSCGTGVAATAWAYKHFMGDAKELSVSTRGGEHRVRFDDDGELWYAGEIKLAFQGELP